VGDQNGEMSQEEQVSEIGITSGILEAQFYTSLRYLSNI
jgi:hypothetical protein